MIPPLVASWCVNLAKNRIWPHIIGDLSAAMKITRATTHGANAMCTTIPADGLITGLVAPACSATGKSRSLRLGHKDTYARAAGGPLGPRGRHHWAILIAGPWRLASSRAAGRSWSTVFRFLTALEGLAPRGQSPATRITARAAPPMRSWPHTKKERN